MDFSIHTWIKYKDGTFWTTLGHSPLKFDKVKGSLVKRDKLPPGFRFCSGIYSMITNLSRLRAGLIRTVDINVNSAMTKAVV
jgi:hypothetical protein